MSKGFVTINVGPAEREALRQLAYEASARLGRRVSLSAAFAALLSLKDEHLDELITHIDTHDK